LNEKTWYLVQTNYDRENKDPWDDRRRYPAEKRMATLGSSITID